MSSGIELKLSPALLVFCALIGALAIAIVSFTFIAFGRASPSMIGYGLISTSLFAFLLTIQVSRGKSETKDEFVKKGSVRTAIATSLTVAYLMLLAFGLDPSSGLSLNNGVLGNFHIVYIFTMGVYFVTASLERIVDLVKARSSLFS